MNNILPSANSFSSNHEQLCTSPSSPTGYRTSRRSLLILPHLQEHFTLAGAAIMPLTAEGRVTVFILQFNHPDRLQERDRLLAIGQYL